MAGDASFASVSTLLHLDEDFTDSAGTPKLYYPYGGVSIDNVAKFGAGSMLCSAGAAYITTAYHADFDFGTGAFTIEMWIRPDSFASERYLYSRASGTNGVTRESGLGILSSAAIRFYHGIRGTSQTLLDFTVPAMSASTWYHLAITRDGSGNMRVFLDGVGSSSNPINDATNLDGQLPSYFGCFYSGSVNNPFYGLIDEIRITKGIARYTANFALPSSPFIGGLGQVSGVVRDGAGSLAARVVRAYRRDTGALVRSVTSDAVTGAYAIDCPTLDEVSRIVLDDAASPLYNDIIDRVIPA